MIEKNRRPGFESQPKAPRPEAPAGHLFWTAERSAIHSDDLHEDDAPRDEAPVRPKALLVMADYGVDDPVWDRPLGNGEPVDLAPLGVTDPLIQSLRLWNDRFEHLALTDFEWANPAEEAAWVQDGLRLAHQLQAELPTIDIRYRHADDDRPLRRITKPPRR